MISNDDRRAFAEAMRNVRKLEYTERAATRRRGKARARIDQSSAPESQRTLAAAAPAGSGDPIAFRRPGLSLAQFRQLRRGRLRIHAAIDLHGLTAHQAQRALEEFLAESIHRGLTCVRIVHGKGIGSGPGGPVLKNLVHRLLADNDSVLAFVTADARHGGTGAVFALLEHR